MTNVRAHVSEADTTYGSYKNMNLLNETFVFEIPIYNGMDNTVSPPPSSSGNTNQNSTASVNTIITNIGVRVSGSNISGINLGTTGSDLVNRAKSVNPNASVSVSNTGRLGTGNTITIRSNGEERTYTVIIYGDSNGDGNINIFDLVRNQKIILNSMSTSSASKTAADANKDGKVNIFDLVRIQKHILNTASIEQ